jgi:hypothetical protein
MAEQPPINQKPLDPAGFFTPVWINWFIALVQTVTTFTVTVLRLQTQNVTIRSGNFADPNGFVTADPGSLYITKDGGDVGHLWFKQSGTNTNLNWVEVTIP